MFKQSNFVKIIVTVPTSHANAVREALGSAGAGEQGNYAFCSSSYPSTGRFRPQTGAHPNIGTIGELTEVAEETIEAICHKDKVKAVVFAVKKAHPYEEPAIDIVPRFEVE